MTLRSVLPPSQERSFYEAKITITQFGAGFICHLTGQYTVYSASEIRKKIQEHLPAAHCIFVFDELPSDAPIGPRSMFAFSNIVTDLASQKIRVLAVLKDHPPLRTVLANKRWFGSTFRDNTSVFPSLGEALEAVKPERSLPQRERVHERSLPAGE